MTEYGEKFWDFINEMKRKASSCATCGQPINQSASDDPRVFYFCQPCGIAHDTMIARRKEFRESREKSGLLQLQEEVKRKEQASAYCGASLNDFGNDEEVQAKEFLKDTRQNFLTIMGVSGTGKTRMLYALRNLIGERNCEFWKCYMFCKELQGLASDMKKQLEFVQKITTSNLIFALDDLGKESDSQFLKGEIFNIIDIRNENGLKTILTTKLSFQDITNKYGDSASDRIRAGRVIMLTGKSRRGK